MSLITLTTDFGTRDWFVGTMKGVILSLAPKATLIDITHDIPPGDVWSAAYVIASAFAFFPARTVHLVVVDPGVGSRRAPLAVRAAGYHFVGPDNGVLSLALRLCNAQAIHHIENRILPNPSSTFHGRDIFAPAAAHLSQGISIAKLGPSATSLIRLAWPEPTLSPRVRGSVIYVDKFGDAITNLPNRLLEKSTHIRVGRAGTQRRIPVGSHYQSVPQGRPVALAGSGGCVEIAINGGHAARRLGLRVGSPVSPVILP
jgi:S-adenosylmethionine hydrolase